VRYQRIIAEARRPEFPSPLEERWLTRFTAIIAADPAERRSLAGLCVGCAGATWHPVVWHRAAKGH
jgi:hypothetical protein